MSSIVRHGAATLLITAALIGAGCAKQSAPATAAPDAAPAEGAVIAKVNGVEITGRALADMMNGIEKIDRQAAEDRKPPVRKRALDQLILQELAYQEAVRRDMHVQESVIDRTMEQAITVLGHEEGYRDYLQKRHMTPVEFRAEIERSLLVQTLLIDEVVKKTAVTDEELRHEYERRRAQNPDGKQASFEESRAALRNELVPAAQLKRRLEWEQELKKNAKIELLDPQDRQ